MEIEFKNKDANTGSLVDVKLVFDNAISNHGKNGYLIFYLVHSLQTNFAEFHNKFFSESKLFGKIL